MGRKINVLFDTLFVGTVIAGGTGSAFRADSLFVHAELVVSAKTGAGGTLNVTIEESIDEENWYEFAAFDSMNGVGSQLKKPLNPARFIRAAWSHQSPVWYPGRRPMWPARGLNRGLVVSSLPHFLVFHFSFYFPGVCQMGEV